MLRYFVHERTFWHFVSAMNQGSSIMRNNPSGLWTSVLLSYSSLDHNWQTNNTLELLLKLPFCFPQTVTWGHGSACGLNLPGWLTCQQSQTLPALTENGFQSEASLNPLRKCVHQCKQRKCILAPQISVYVGATSLGCRATLIFFSLHVYVIKLVYFFHMMSEKKTKILLLLMERRMWLLEKSQRWVWWKGSVLCDIRVVTYRLIVITAIHWFSVFGRQVSLTRGYRNHLHVYSLQQIQCACKCRAYCFRKRNSLNQL